MKRIVFSIYTSDIEKNHTSTTSFKRSQFEKYKDKFDFKIFNETFVNENEAILALKNFEAL